MVNKQEVLSRYAFITHVKIKIFECTSLCETKSKNKVFVKNALKASINKV